jgi:hypothetical protein
VREEVVDDGEAACSSGEAWGSSNRRRRSPGTGGSDHQIGAAPASIGCVVWSWRSKDGRRRGWGAQLRPGSPLFIESRGGLRGSGEVDRAKVADLSMRRG